MYSILPVVNDTVLYTLTFAKKAYFMYSYHKKVYMIHDFSNVLFISERQSTSGEGAERKGDPKSEAGSSL